VRIAVFTDTFPPTLNGVARTLGLLVDHAMAAGHEVAVVCPRVEDRDHPGTALHIRIPGMQLPFYRELHAARPWLTPAQSRALKAFAPDVIHCATEALVGMAGRRWARRHGIPLVTSYCTNFPEYIAGYGMGVLENTIWHHLRRFHGGARLTLTPSQTTRRELLARDFHHRIRIWGRGVDAELFHPSRRDDSLRRSLASEADVLLMYVGRLAPEKRIDLLVKAFPAIREATSERVALVLVGGGPVREELEARQVEGIYLAGYRRSEDLAAHFASADVFLFPSDTETFGQVVTEAMASGLPVVAPDRGGVLDTVIPGGTGFLFEAGRVGPLVDAAVRLVQNPGLRDRMGRAARAAAEVRSWQAVFDKLFGDYEAAVRELDPDPDPLPPSPVTTSIRHAVVTDPPRVGTGVDPTFEA